MKRSDQRKQAFVLIFENMFNSDNENTVELYSENFEPVSDYANVLFSGVKEKSEELDNSISTYLNGWKISRLSKVNLAILRLAFYEIAYVDDVPPSVAINEAVELAKEYSSKEDASFINGVLGSYVRSME